MTQPTTAAPAAPARPRLESIDLLRGLVMVLMAIDHVRHYFHFEAIQGHDPTDLDLTTPAVFFTRFITHFCAPIFAFLAGTGTSFSAARGKPRGELASFLVSRGAWLIFLDLTLYRWLAWQFDITLHSYILAILWALGWSMVFLALIIRLPVRVVGGIGVALIVVHNAFDGIAPNGLGGWGPLWQVLHAGGTFTVGGDFLVTALYPLLPWFGVMAAGYAFGWIYHGDPTGRRRKLALLGFGLVAAFVALRFTNWYGDPHRWETESSPLYTMMSFLNVTKYPPSLLYLLLTLGVACLLLSWFEFDRGTPQFLRPLIVFGRAPMFYYLLHIPLIHAIAWICYTAKYGRADFFAPGNAPIPAGVGFGLGVVYLVWAFVVVALYPLCIWFVDLKKRHRDWVWLSYF